MVLADALFMMETPAALLPAAAASGSYVVGTLPASCRYALTNATTQAAATRIIHLWAVGRWG